MAWGIWKKLKDGAKKMVGKVSNFFKNGGVTKVLDTTAKVLDVAGIRNDTLAADSRGLTKSGDCSHFKISLIKAKIS